MKPLYTKEDLRNLLDYWNERPTNSKNYEDDITDCIEEFLSSLSSSPLVAEPKAKEAKSAEELRLRRPFSTHSVRLLTNALLNDEITISRLTEILNSMSLTEETATNLLNKTQPQTEVAQKGQKETPCDHPADKREPYHDSTIVCRKCNCVIEQFGVAINPPHKLSML